MRNEIKEYFKNKRANFETVRHPFINNSVLVKIGNEYLYFLTPSGEKKVNMKQFYSQFCKA
jgi:hypothetical protein